MIEWIKSDINNALTFGCIIGYLWNWFAEGVFLLGQYLRSKIDERIRKTKSNNINQRTGA